MKTIRTLLGGVREPVTVVLRPPRAGELGWVVHRHGVLYAEEFGSEEPFEALIARLIADYAEHHDRSRESAGIAELNGAPVGSVFCLQWEETVAQLRFLLVEPHAGALGTGGRLVEECLRHARRARYEEIMLWTQAVLRHARRIYERAGFELVRSETHATFGPQVLGQTW
jgi:GNAT superfamily N-acetyltransferase